MSGTMSGSSNQWLHFYQNNHPTTALPTWSSGDAATDATVVTTTTTTANNSTTTTIANQLNRVNRPTNTRRRSRASRKTPTTLLNTDTTNFRAMVQRFTGGGNNNNTASGAATDATSSPSFLSNESSIASTQQFFTTYDSNPSSFNNGLASVPLRPNDGYNLQFRQPHHQPYDFSMMMDDGESGAGGEGDDQNMGFRQRGSYDW